MNKPIAWDKLFIEITKLVALRSKDPITKVGALLVSPDKRKIHYGYNAFPYKIQDTPDRWERPFKYSRVCHGEINAILNAKEDLAGWTLYLSIPPCNECCKTIIQAGIKKIIYITEYSRGSSLDYSRDLLEEAGVEIIKYKEEE